MKSQKSIVATLSAQDRFGRQMAAYLDTSAAALPHDISERLRVARLQAPRRKAGQSPALEFKALVSNQFNEADSWALCLAGVPGRLNVPEAELTRAELDVKALYQTERAQLVQAGDRQIRLQPVEQLAHRYQTLLRTQAEKVMGGSGVSGDASPSK